MKSQSDFDSASDGELRRRAEERLRGVRDQQARAPADQRALQYELEVHQVELQMQNEALRETCAELELSRERYRELFEHAPVAYLDLDADGGIRDCNHAAAALLGAPIERLRGKPLSTFVVSEHAELFEHHRRQVLASETRVTCMLALAGGEEPRAVRVESARSGKSQPLWRCTMVDVTELHRLQRRLQEMQKLEAMSTLASGMAHEFNNMLMAMLGLADIALNRMAPEDAGREPIALLHQAGLRGRSVVDQLLTFAHGRNPRDQVIDINALIESSAPLLRQLLGDDIALELELAAQNALISGDPGQCQQILMNLASNARHALPEGGVLRIETRDGTDGALGAQAHADLGFRPCVLLKVSDNGVGMSTEARARAFEPFFTTKPAGVGTGLGLSMVYDAVRKAGGHIELDSRPGAGTTVQIHWPIAAGARPSHGPAGRLPAMPSGSLHVLVVDDDRLVRMALRHYLQLEGWVLSEAESGEAAMQLLRASDQPVHLLVTDVVLRGQKGMQLAAAARALQPQLAVVFVSAYSADVLTERGLFEPSLPLLHKPFTREELRQAISDALAMQEWEHAD